MVQVRHLLRPLPGGVLRPAADAALRPEDDLVRQADIHRHLCENLPQGDLRQDRCRKHKKVFKT